MSHTNPTLISIAFIFVCILFTYSSHNSNDDTNCSTSGEQCEEEVTPTEPIGIDLSQTSDIQTESEHLVDNINLSECVSDEWLNQNGTLDGYHVLCVEKNQKQLNIQYFIGGVDNINSNTNTNTNGNIQISMSDITDIFTLRNVIQNILSIVPRGPGYNEWTMYNANGQKIETLTDFLQYGTILIYEGGIFMWPPIYIGYKRYIQIKNADNSNNNMKPFLNYKLETISYHPIVILIENFIPHSYCDHIISLSEPKMKDSGVSHMHNTGGSARKWRTSTTAWLRPSGNDIIINIINNYTEQILNIPQQHQELMQVLRYKETQQYDSHWDYFDILIQIFLQYQMNQKLVV
eukprot:290527_1